MHSVDYRRWLSQDGPYKARSTPIVAPNPYLVCSRVTAYSPKLGPLRLVQQRCSTGMYSSADSSCCCPSRCVDAVLPRDVTHTAALDWKLGGLQQLCIFVVWQCVQRSAAWPVGPPAAELCGDMGVLSRSSRSKPTEASVFVSMTRKHLRSLR